MAITAVPALSDIVAPAAAEVGRTGAYPRTDVESASRWRARTTDALHDLVGRATLGLPLFGGAR